MDPMPKFDRDAYVAALRVKMEAVLGQVADAINDAPVGHIIAASERQVFDLFATLRREAFEAGIQMRADARAALAYLKDRHDADPRGVGVFGVSKGGSVGLMLAAEDTGIRCVVTDGAFATYSTMVPYMRRWVNIYSPNRRKLQAFAPDFMYGGIGLAAMKRVADARKVRFPWVERAVRRVRVPLFMIHGQADTYIKPEMAVALFEKSGSADKQFWLVPKAKHNQGPQVEPAAYFDKLTAFFDAHLARLPDPSDQFGHDPREVLPTPRAVWDEREVAPTPRVAV